MCLFLRLAPTANMTFSCHCHIAVTIQIYTFDHDNFYLPK